MKRFLECFCIFSIIGCVAYMVYKFLNDGLAYDAAAMRRGDDDLEDWDDMIDLNLWNEE